MRFVRELGLAGAIAVALMSPAHAEAGASEGNELARKAATAACADQNAYGPVSRAEAIEDGVGDWLVWVEDRDGDLWICIASAAGAVYANALIEGDLLAGKGGTLVTSAEPAGGSDPGAEQAASFCLAVGAVVDKVDVVVTVPDGMGDYLVWLKNADDALWLCNASVDAKLYAFEKVGDPLGSQDEPSADLAVARDRLSGEL